MRNGCAGAVRLKCAHVPSVHRAPHLLPCVRRALHAALVLVSRAPPNLARACCARCACMFSRLHLVVACSRACCARVIYAVRSCWRSALASFMRAITACAIRACVLRSGVRCAHSYGAAGGERWGGGVTPVAFRGRPTDASPFLLSVRGGSLFWFLISVVTSVPRCCRVCRRASRRLVPLFLCRVLTL